MASFLIGTLIFSWSMGFGALIHQEDLMKVKVVKKVGAKNG
jgi:hypothetical protein